MWLKSFFKAFVEVCLDLLFPKRCAVCRKTIYGCREAAVCFRCINKKLNPKYVKSKDFFFDEAVCALRYADTAKEAMLKYKFQSIRYYAKAYAFLMDKAAADRPSYREAIICPVPLSKGREREYNQTALIAREIASMWGSEYIEELLCKCREVSPLSKMKLHERRFYIGGSIEVNPEYDVYGKDVLIIDDIFTSGTTANECARMLKMYGAAKVYVLCACYD